MIPLIASTWAFTVALLANPITLVVLGIAALIAAIVALWKNWDTVTNWLGKVFYAVWEGIVSAFEWYVGKIKSAAAGAWELLKTIFSWSPFALVMRAYGAMFNWLNEKFAIFDKK